MSDVSFGDGADMDFDAGAEMDGAMDTGDAANDALGAWDDGQIGADDADTDYEPSVGGVDYPDPERMEGNVGGPEALG